MDDAIITIENGNIHLDYTFNYGASESIQIEEYDHDGWNEPQEHFKGMSDRQFWDLWCDWNGRMYGGIWLHDNKTEKQIDRFCTKMCGNATYNVCDIPNLPNGTYRVLANPFVPTNV